MKKYIFWIAGLLSANIGFAQIAEPTKGLLSPNAASIGKYGDFDVSYYTGTVDVSVPLYTFSSRGIDLPLTLKYDASGVRVNSQPSWVGQNWTLMAGGAITRIAQGGYEDEYYDIHHTANFHNYFSSYQTINQIVAAPSAVDNITYNGLIGYDFQPDIFIFNFMGITGNFFLGNDGQWKVESDFNIDVVFDINNSENFDYPFIENCVCEISVKQCKSISGFKLQDGNGNTYTFGYNKNAIEYYINFFNQVGSSNNRPTWMPNCWYLTEVKDKYSNIVYKLEYDRGYYIAHLYPQYQRIGYKETSTGQALSQFLSIIGLGFLYFPEVNSFNESSSILPFYGDLISPVYLKSIEDVANSTKATFSKLPNEDPYYSDNGTLLDYEYFSYHNNVDAPYLTGDCGNSNSYIWNNIKKYVYDPDAPDGPYVRPGHALKGLKMMKLSQIYINNNINKKFVFSYNNNILNQGRLFLTKITETTTLGNNISTGREYVFSYQVNTNFPDYLSYKTDHWGYYNGTDTKTYCTPNNIKKSNEIYSAKNTNSSLITSGMLNTITYPTKGKTVFQYERHDYSKILNYDGQSVYNESGVAGGVRIQQIFNYDNNGTLINQRNFYYSETKNGASSGQLAAKPRYHWEWTTKTGSSGRNSVTIDKYNITSIIPLSNSFSTHIGYSYVIEEEVQNGYTRYKFDNFSDIKDDLPIYSYTQTKPSPYDKRSEKASMLGRIRKKEIYKNNSTQPVREDIYNYDNINTGKFTYSSSVLSNFGSTGYFYFVTGDIYKLYYNKQFLKEVITNESFNNNYNIYKKRQGNNCQR